MSVVPSGMAYCRKCGAELRVEYCRAGIDGFFGYAVYQSRGRCPNGRWRFDGWFTDHDETQWTYPESARHYGFTDETMPQGYDQGLGEEPKPDPTLTYTDPAGGPDWEPREDEA